MSTKTGGHYDINRGVHLVEMGYGGMGMVAARRCCPTRPSGFQPPAPAARSRVGARGQRSSSPIGRASLRPAIRLSHWLRARLARFDWSVGGEVREANWAVGGQRGQWAVARVARGKQGVAASSWPSNHFPEPPSKNLSSEPGAKKGQECWHLNILKLT